VRVRLFGKKREPPEEWPDHVVTLAASTFDHFADKYPLLMVDFWAGWCGPCRTMAPRIRQLAKKYEGRAAFGKVDVVKEKPLAERYRVLSLPTLVFFSYGKKVGQLMGVKQVGDIEDELERLLKRHG